MVREREEVFICGRGGKRRGDGCGGVAGVNGTGKKKNGKVGDGWMEGRGSEFPLSPVKIFPPTQPTTKAAPGSSMTTPRYRSQSIHSFHSFS